MEIKKIALLLLAFSCCHCSKPDPAPAIEGMWISTEESSHLFEPGADEVALWISRDSAGMPSAQGFFMYNGEFKMEWEFQGAEYDQEARRISILDADSDTLVLQLETEGDLLKGAICLQDYTQLPLDFVRDDGQVEIRLFHPRVPDESGRITYRYEAPEETGDGLNTGSIFDYSIDSSSVSELLLDIIDQKYGSIKSLLVLKDNRLLLEEYFYGYSREETQLIRSCTKSVTSLLLGMALDRHEVAHVDQSIFTFFPGYEPLMTEGREQITLKHVLTMYAGFEWDDIPPEMFTSDDCFQFILSRPLEAEPGEAFIYNSGCSVLLGGIVSHLEKVRTQDFAADALFDPLGVTAYAWDTVHDGTLNCGSGLSLRPRDMAKIGLLVLNDGRWEDQQLVSKTWIRESTKAQVPESPYYDYAYHWWHRSGSTLQWWKEPHAADPGEYEMIAAMGHGGQYIMIIRDLNLVVVTTATDFEDGMVAQSKIPMVVEEIIPLFESEAL